MNVKFKRTPSGGVRFEYNIFAVAHINQQMAATSQPKKRHNCCL